MNKEDFINIVKPFSMTTIERIIALFESLEHIRLNNIHGDIVECGVWKGGNILGIIEYLYFHKIIDKTVWLYDTFNGMTPPEKIDIDINNKEAKTIMHLPHVVAYASIEEVKGILSKSSFDKLRFIIGDISETLKKSENIPKSISLLRLDTDWYKSTKDELNYLYPRLVINGHLIVDDYGHWQGARLAFDEYFKFMNINIQNIDYTGIKIVKSE